MALFATTTTTDIWASCGTDVNPTPCPVSTSSSGSSTPLSTTIESSTATTEPTLPPAPHPMTSSVGYILIGVAIPTVIIIIGACIFYWRRRRRAAAAAAAAAAAPPLEPPFPIEKNESDAEKGYGDVRLDTAVSELDPGPGGMGKVFIAELDGSSMVGCMELDSSPVMSMSPGAGIKSNLFVSGAGFNASMRNSQFSAVSGVRAGAETTSSMRGNGFAGAGAGTGASAGSNTGFGVGAGVATGVNNNAFIAELEAPLDASEVDKKRLELEGNDAPQITEVEIPSSILFTVKKGSSGEN
ncbi:uncharacterized protein H6S33_003311 [Morchella sextelata]|uniref:uncharacterized protein n=1 Tax=Morchella sextelata TaxID=1174677 RepID=UPI001D03F9E4|nr:uncharacterized protein H6S33_003311 [Morchella sextelata]KAH0607323.1 hypothetical protein H6S33_003311 [Morchella sextelata]